MTKRQPHALVAHLCSALLIHSHFLKYRLQNNICLFKCPWVGICCYWGRKPSFSMKTVITCFLLTFSLTFISHRADAQWTIFSDLLSQMDQGTQGFFFNNLDSLNPNLNPNIEPGNDLLDQLNNNLLDSIPPGSFDSSYLSGLGAGLDTLLVHLPGFGLTGADQDTLLGDLNWIGDILGNNFDSLGGLFGQYHDSLSFDSMNWEVNILGFDSLVNQQYGYLEDSVNIVGNLSDPNGPGDFANISGQLFDVNLFPDIELAFGVQNADLKYYEDRYSATAKIVRIGSVPRFDRNVFDCNGHLPRFPIEPRWHVDVSWTDEDRPTPLAGDATAGRADSDSKGFNPLMMSGDFAMMTTPGLGTWGNTSFRLLTSLGTEFGTYAPAHRDYAPPFTNYNKGYMTGLGAQAGAGFAFTTGSLTVYSLCTYAQGQALRCPKPYPYTSRRYEVGMRYGNIINVRYSNSFVSWQTDENRQANVRNQFTVGIILAELHH